MKIEIVILSDPDYYPPTINAANILAERGHEVSVIGIRYPNVHTQAIHSSVKKIYYDSHRTGLKNVWQYFSFYLWFLFRVYKIKPDWIIAYDGMAVGPVSFASSVFNKKWMFHSHDVFVKMNGWYKLIAFIERKFVRKAFIVSFPQEDRAFNFMKIAHLKSFPLIVYNGPRMKWSTFKKPIHSELNEWYDKNRFIILYQGQFSKYFNLENLIRSLTYLQEEFVLCLIGRALEDNILSKYVEIINQKGLLGRVKILQPVSYDEIPSITNYCKIGVAKLGMSKDIPFNDYYLTGASNKVSEYLSFGLPILMANTNVNIKFYQQYGFSIFADGSSPENIAASIHNIWNPIKKYESLKFNACKAGKDIFNYDVQFSKIVSILEN